ncbi:type IV pilus assembly protein PilO [Bathymodiolus platifrons methanotrophic gill symbiont]|uniref:pilus assembly protein PilP n=1 Tax=Bathymodiolus platifrons methanotrophic gill symbiont TaxID=113268 RepID=UPI000B661C72|nr:pilus assembly protein PilP [Bathymodiolus platifrons methanotrophic gill symbiont]GAW86071.1 type IV pilus assembly protein PilO [Bathymodiolus platifrons methanotrophic gill symbiont]GFO77796.1 type IV pilus assembly protein PilO [Bathymodiolus platifrons methanotrophic gill symbiont]
MNFSEINWDINEAGAWPKPIKVAAGVLVFIIIVSFGYYKFTSEKVAQLNTEKKEVADALNNYQYAWRMAQNLELHQKQYKQIQSSLAEMMKLMPTKAEVASLLIDISQTGLSSGLEFELFKPAGKINKGDVIELPINIKVIGQYSELGLFISGLATLPRIVTIKNIQINPANNMLAMSALITTYREGNSQVESDAKVLDNSALVCLEHDGLVVAGCKKKSTVVTYPELEQRLKEKRKNIKAISVRPIEPMPPVGSFLFNPDGLRDPFKPIEKSMETLAAKAVASNGIQPDFNRRKEELESYSLDTLRMVGTVKMKSVLWGLIKASDGTIHRVSEGNYLGKNYGCILRILQDAIEIVEIVPDQPGTWREHQTLIALSE